MIWVFFKIYEVIFLFKWLNWNVFLNLLLNYKIYFIKIFLFNNINIFDFLDFNVLLRYI